MIGRHPGRRIAMGVIFFIAFAFAMGWVVRLLWNALIPSLFHGPLLTYWQALGLMILLHILIKGPAHNMERHKWRNPMWRRDFEGRVANMPPEERAKLRSYWSSCCGYHCEPEENKATSEAK